MSGGFTLVELIVVVVLLGVVAGLVVPRIVGGEMREVRGELTQVQGALSAAAFRHAVSGTHTRIRYSQEEGEERGRGDGEMELVVEVLTPEDSEAESPVMVWRRDRLSSSVVIDAVEIEEIRVDGYPVDDEDEWEIVFVAGQVRAAVEMTVGMRNGESEWLVELLPSETVAVVRDVDGAVSEDRTVDLDAAGLGESAW